PGAPKSASTVSQLMVVGKNNSRDQRASAIPGTAGLTSKFTIGKQALLGDRGGLCGIRHLDHQIFERFRLARVAGHRMQRVGRLVEYLARLQASQRPIEDVADRMASRMPMR